MKINFDYKNNHYFAYGNTLVMNFVDNGYIFEDIFVDSMGYNILDNPLYNSGVCLPDDGMNVKPSWESVVKIDMTMKARKVKKLNKPLDFKDFLAKLTIEDMFKLINKKINGDKNGK